MAALQAGGLLARRYRLIDRIGAGGMSVIWRARDEVLDRVVAVKVLAASLAADAKFREMVREEARAAAQLVHPHVTAVHDYGETLGPDGGITAFVVMELLTGEELKAELTAGPLPWQTAVEICAQVAEALAAAHRLGIVHRDITPANIMMTATGAKVLDFGIATQVGAPDEDEDGETFGTPAYVAPERLDGLPAQPATDTYSLGVLLHETLTGRVPFPADTWEDLSRALETGTEPTLTGVPDLPPAVADVCLRCLARDPVERPTAAQVGELLRQQLLAADPRRVVLSHTRPGPVLVPPPLPAPVATGATGSGAVGTVTAEARSAEPGATETAGAGDGGSAVRVDVPGRQGGPGTGQDAAALPEPGPPAQPAARPHLTPPPGAPGTAPTGAPHPTARPGTPTGPPSGMQPAAPAGMQPTAPSGGHAGAAPPGPQVAAASGPQAPAGPGMGPGAPPGRMASEDRAGTGPERPGSAPDQTGGSGEPSRPGRVLLVAAAVLAALTVTVVIASTTGSDPKSKPTTGAASDRPDAAPQPGPTGTPVPTVEATRPPSTSPPGRRPEVDDNPNIPPQPLGEVMAQLYQIVDDGVATNAIREHAGVDLRNQLRNLRADSGSGAADLAGQVSLLRDKVTVRRAEGSISPEYAELLDAALVRLARAV